MAPTAVRQTQPYGKHSRTANTAVWQTQPYGNHSRMAITAIWHPQPHGTHSRMATTAGARLLCVPVASMRSNSYRWPRISTQGGLRVNLQHHQHRAGGSFEPSAQGSFLVVRACFRACAAVCEYSVHSGVWILLGGIAAKLIYHISLRVYGCLAC